MQYTQQDFYKSVKAVSRTFNLTYTTLFAKLKSAEKKGEITRYKEGYLKTEVVKLLQDQNMIGGDLNPVTKPTLLP